MRQRRDEVEKKRRTSLWACVYELVLLFFTLRAGTYQQENCDGKKSGDSPQRNAAIREEKKKGKQIRRC